MVAISSMMSFELTFVDEFLSISPTVENLEVSKRSSLDISVVSEEGKEGCGQGWKRSRDESNPPHRKSQNQKLGCCVGEPDHCLIKGVFQSAIVAVLVLFLFLELSPCLLIHPPENYLHKRRCVGGQDAVLVPQQWRILHVSPRISGEPVPVTDTNQ
jgi:hypothetical protein